MSAVIFGLLQFMFWSSLNKDDISLQTKYKAPGRRAADKSDTYFNVLNKHLLVRGDKFSTNERPRKGLQIDTQKDRYRSQILELLQQSGRWFQT